MRSGLRPIHSVDTITCTSEMSGTASTGVCVIAQMPQSVRTMIPVKTTNRLAAHQSMMRLIILYFLAGPHIFYRAGAPPPALLLGMFTPRNGSRLSLADASRARRAPRLRPLAWPQALAGHDRHLFGSQSLAVARDADGHVPPPGHHHVPRSSIDSATNRQQLHFAPHRRHVHR